MKTLLAVLIDFKIYFNVYTKSGRKHALILGILIITGLGVWRFMHKEAEVTDAAPTPPTVTVLSVAELASDSHFDTVGKVEAVSEADLQAEAGGRVTSVSVKVGDAVAAGTVLATIENSAQRASLVQAQGSYEAALAASAQNDLGVSGAQNNLTSAQNVAVSTFQNSYNTVNGTFLNSIDNFYSLSNSTIIGLKIDGNGYKETLNAERTSFRTVLPEWQSKANSITSNSNIESELKYARTQTDRTIALVDIFITIFNQPGSVGGYSDADLKGYTASFTALRGSLIGTRSSIDAALSGLSAAKEGVKRAQISASGGQVSASGAQLKIAAGSLQAAQASYQKTIVRTPIRGVVNALYLKTGSYIAPGQPAAIVANNGGLQIKTFVNEVDSASLNVGDTVTVEGDASGVITAKAAALDPSNGKVAVVIGVNQDSSLTNGSTVKVTFSQLSTKTQSDKIVIPLSALKITSEGSFVFIVENSTLKAVPVTKGQLYGDTVEITEGISKDTRIVTDARGLKDGQKVTIAK